jgi:hypothetical protein
MEDWAVGQAEDFIAEAKETGFDEAAGRRNITKRSFGPVPLNYGNIDLFTTLGSFSVPELSNSAANENFWRTAFSTPVNTASEPLVQGGTVAVLFPTGETAAEESSVESIASTYSNYWLSAVTEQSIRPCFINSKKMKSRFSETYAHIFMPQSN